MSSRKEALSQFINQIHGRAVVVKLNSGVDYRGNFSVSNYLLTLFVYRIVSQASLHASTAT